MIFFQANPPPPPPPAKKENVLWHADVRRLLTRSSPREIFLAIVEDILHDATADVCERVVSKAKPKTRKGKCYFGSLAAIITNCFYLKP